MAVDFEPGLSLFAVFDGHGGCEVAKYCEEFFLKELQADSDFKSKNYEKALRNVFVRIDSNLLTEQGKKDLSRIARQAATGNTFDGGDLSH